jgi:hypothetical protein
MALLHVNQRVNICFIATIDNQEGTGDFTSIVMRKFPSYETTYSG